MIHSRFLAKSGIKASLIVLITVSCFTSYSQSLDSIKVVKPGATLVKVSDQFSFTEGPAVDKKGNIFFTDQPNDKIWKYDTEAKLSVFMDKTGRSNGMYFDPKGKLISCADSTNELWSIDGNGKYDIILKDFNGVKFNGPNDLWIAKNGDIYFTDPYYQRPYWTRKKPDISKQSLYYFSKKTKQVIVVDSTMVQPNGIVGSADGKFLFVADIGGNKTYKYEIDNNGIPVNRQFFVAQGSDGITLDNMGNVYLTGMGVTIYDSNGTKIGNIKIPSRWTANICFGGKDRSTLFITATESVYTLDMNVKGVE